MPINNRIAAFVDDMTRWRRDLHAHPELGFEEHRTSALVAERLAEWGIEVHKGIAGTGVVGVLCGTGSSGRAVGLRADMDALPMTEESTSLEYRSTHPGKMHACGHDGHTTMLLGAARHLAETRNFDGTVVFIFQPAEEGGGGGRVMVEEGLFRRFPVDSVWGMHNSPMIPAGQFEICPGPAMAAADRFEIVLTGVGGHAARPHACVDPVAAGVQVHQAVQTIVSRNLDPVECGVISITQFHAGEASNVIPSRATLAGTVRSYKPEIRRMLERRIREVVAGIASALGVTGVVNYDPGYPPLVNGIGETKFAAQIAGEIVGPEAVSAEAPPLMGAEDFSYMLQERPGAMIWVGQGGGPSPYAVHHPMYDFNDAILPIGASYWVKLVETSLPRTV